MFCEHPPHHQGIITWLKETDDTVLNVNGPSGCGKTYVVRQALESCGVDIVEVHPADTQIQQVIDMLLHKPTLVVIVVYIKDIGTCYDTCLQKLCNMINSKRKIIVISHRQFLTRRVKRSLTFVKMKAPTLAFVQDLLLKQNNSLTKEEIANIAVQCNYDLNLCLTTARTGFVSTKDESFYDIQIKVSEASKGKWTDDFRVCNIISAVYLNQKNCTLDTVCRIAEAIKDCDNLHESYYGIVALSTQHLTITNVTETSNHSSRKSMNLKSLNSLKGQNMSIWDNNHPDFWSLWAKKIKAYKTSTNEEMRVVLQPGWKLAYRMGNLRNTNTSVERKRIEKIYQLLYNGSEETT